MPYWHSSTSSTRPFLFVAAQEWSFSSSPRTRPRKPYTTPKIFSSESSCPDVDAEQVDGQSRQLNVRFKSQLDSFSRHQRHDSQFCGEFTQRMDWSRIGTKL